MPPDGASRTPCASSQDRRGGGRPPPSSPPRAVSGCQNPAIAHGPRSATPSSVNAPCAPTCSKPATAEASSTPMTGSTPSSCAETPARTPPAPRSSAPNRTLAQSASGAWRRDHARRVAASGSTATETGPRWSSSPRAPSITLSARSLRIERTRESGAVVASTAGIASSVPSWIEEWKPKRIVCAYDADSAGDDAAERLAVSDPRVIRLRPPGRQGLERDTAALAMNDRPLTARANQPSAASRPSNNPKTRPSITERALTRSPGSGGGDAVHPNDACRERETDAARRRALEHFAIEYLEPRGSRGRRARGRDTIECADDARTQTLVPRRARSAQHRGAC